jgi:trans-aconitate 2-methyltransferase
VVFANASLQWVAGHVEVLTRWRSALRKGGQLAVQVPSNADHPSQTVADELGDEWLGEKAPPNHVTTTVLKPDSYARLLDDLGFERQHVRLQVYGHHLDSTAAVVEWMKGTALTRFRAVFDDAEFSRFVDEYRHRLVAVLGDQSPYFYPFKRILMWGRLGM